MNEVIMKKLVVNRSNVLHSLSVSSCALLVSCRVPVILEVYLLLLVAFHINGVTLFPLRIAFFVLEGPYCT